MSAFVSHVQYSYPNPAHSGPVSIGLELSLVDVEASIGPLCANFGGQGSTAGAVRLNGHSHGSSCLFALQTNGSGVVIVQDVWYSDGDGIELYSTKYNLLLGEKIQIRINDGANQARQ